MDLHSDMTVTYIQRRPRTSGNYSLEAIFDDVRRRLPNIGQRVIVAPFLSNGVFRRLAIVLSAAWQQGELNHVTGDITFAALLLKKNRCVLTILDCIDVDSRSGLSGWLYRKLWFEWPVARSSVVTTISEASKNDIVRITRCDPNKVIVTGVAISERFKRVDKEFNSQYPRILQVGTSYNKNLERLAEALADRPCKLVIVGQLSQLQLQALTKHKIDFENHVGLSSEQLVQQYVDADIIAFVSTFEGFGMPILEGNAVGRPVITGNCTSMPEVAGNAACIVDPFDTSCIRAGFDKILAEKSYRQSLVTNGFENCIRFDPNMVANRYLQAYKLVMSNNRSNIKVGPTCM